MFTAENLSAFEKLHNNGNTVDDVSHHEIVDQENVVRDRTVENALLPESSDNDSRRYDSDQSLSSISEVCSGPNDTTNVVNASLPSILEKQISSSEPDMETLKGRLSMWKSYLNLSAMIALVGSVRFTVEHYEFARQVIQDAGFCVTWPPYSRVQKQFTIIVNSIFPKSELALLPKKQNVRTPNELYATEMPRSHNSSPDLEGNETDREENRITEKEEVRIFLLSAWAKLDVSTSVVFDEMYPAFENENDTCSPLDKSDIVQNRDILSRACDHILVEHEGSVVRARNHDDITVQAMETAPIFANPYRLYREEEKYSITGRIVATWSVGSDSQHETKTTASFNRIMNHPSLSHQQKSVISMLGTASIRTPEESSNNQVTPGDICTLLVPDETSCTFFPVLVRRYCRKEDGLPSVVMLWIESAADSVLQFNRDLCSTRVVSTHDVQKVRIDKFGNENASSSLVMKQPFGRLANGMPFVVYRILLYCDDFQKSSQLSKAGSAGGCYFLPLSMPVEKRRSTSSVRIISLTPPGVSTNDVLHYIVPDLVHAGTYGVDGHTPTGEKVRIFVNVLGFVGDYPASAGVIDVIGHTGRSPCTLCSFRRLQESSAEGSRFGYTTKVHSNNSSALRNIERHNALTESNFSDQDAERLGMVSNRKYGDRECPLLYLQREMESKRSRAALREDGTPIIAGTFDAYRNNFVAVDHLLTGISKNVLTALFRTLPSEDLQTKTDVRICAALQNNGLLPQREVFNKSTQSLHSMTLSEIFCVLDVSVPVMKNIISWCPSDLSIHDCFDLLKKLQNLVAYTYWWPQIELDGWLSMNRIRNDRHSYFSDLRSMSKEYVEAVDRSCRKCAKIKKQVDKPNLHRLIELYEHTIPAFGHVREVMELVFESAHQPLKRSINRIKSERWHIFAVEQSVGNDWQGRIAALSRAATENNKAAKRGIRRLFLGEEADLLDDEMHSDFKNKCDRVLARLFTSSVGRQFRKSSMVSYFCTSKDPYWKARTVIAVEHIALKAHVTLPLLRGIVRLAKRWIKALYPSLPEDGQQRDLALNLYKSARRLKMTTYGNQIGKPYGHDSITTNCSVVVHLDPRNNSKKIIMSSTEEATTRPHFFAIVAILEQKGELPFAICLKCSKRGQFLQRSAPFSEESFQILRLTPEVRRIGLYHACNYDNNGVTSCKVDLNRREVSHSKSLLDGALFFFQCRAQGYPPRMA